MYSDIILDKYQVRKNKKQKNKFFSFVRSECDKHGYKCEIEKGSLGSQNIVIGEPEKAKVIYTAHYDTCAALPFPNFITPKNFLLYLLYQVVICIPLIAIIACGNHIVSRLVPDDAIFTEFVLREAVVFGALLVFLCMLIFGIANKHTANDNTSGVVTVMELMAKMPSELKENAAYILFDYEEVGLIGSSSYASKHKEIAKNTLIVNFDCVSDGKTILFVVNKGASTEIPLLEGSFISNDIFTVDIANKNVFYPSDQVSFKKGIGVASLKKTKKGTLYMDRIHTKHDTVFQKENIDFLVNGSIALTEKI